jgi:hypothetical protein
LITKWQINQEALLRSKSKLAKGKVGETDIAKDGIKSALGSLAKQMEEIGAFIKSAEEVVDSSEATAGE